MPTPPIIDADITGLRLDMPEKPTRAPRMVMRAAPFSAWAWACEAVGCAAIGAGVAWVGWCNDEWLGLLCGAVGAVCVFVPWIKLREHQEDVARVAEANEKIEAHRYATDEFMARHQLLLTDALRQRDAAQQRLQPFIEPRDRDAAGRWMSSRGRAPAELGAAVAPALNAPGQSPPTIEGEVTP